MPPRKAPALEKVPPPSQEDGGESDASDEMSDPEDDICDEERDFECVREAARDRVAPRTRTQYDLFVGLMKAFFVSQPELKHEVTQGNCKMPLSIHAVSRYLDHVESKRKEYETGKYKPVSPSYYRAVVRSVRDLYVCGQMPIDESLSLLLYSKCKTYCRRIADMKALGTYPIGPTRAISGQGYRLLCGSLAKAAPAEDGGWAWHLVSCVWSYVVLL